MNAANLFFKVINGTMSGAAAENTTYLIRGNWDDWFSFQTTFTAIYYNESKRPQTIGQLKIGEKGLKAASSSDKPGHRSPSLPESFEGLSDSFFSLGQDASYYENLTAIGPTFRQSFLEAMNDIALNENLLEEVKVEEVTGTSLLRDVPLNTVTGQLRRLSKGGARLTSYALAYSLPINGTKRKLDLEFDVSPNSTPPTNIHVLIGRNGVGKSTTLDSIARYEVERSKTNQSSLSNLVSVSFSAFDTFTPLSVPRDRTKMTYHYVGLKKVSKNSDDSEFGAELKQHSALSSELTRALRDCSKGSRLPRLARAIEILDRDPIFNLAGLADLLNEEDSEELIRRAPDIFRKLSSGHKIVLLSIVKLVQTVEERSLVLIDEPEAHLHPPLLSSFIRALSDLLTDRNGIAIVATHSPVVLQEVPRECVWKLQRRGRLVERDRPETETFGESLAVLTDEIFGLEVTGTGYHKMLNDLATQCDSYEEALGELHNQLGREGKAILRSMFAANERNANVAR